MKNPVLFVRISICWICFHVNACDRHKLEEKNSGSSAVTTKNNRNASHNRIRRNQSSDTQTHDDALLIAWQSTLGDARDRELLRLFRIHPDSSAEFLANLALEKKELQIAKTLGKCCGSFGNESWMVWIKDRFQGEYLTMASLGYAEGLAGLSSKEALSYIKDMSPGDVRERCMGSVILALCKAGDPDFEDMMFQWIENSSREGWGRNPLVIEVIREIMARHKQSDIKDILFQERFINLGNDSGGGLAALIAEKDPSLAVQWSMSLKSLRERQEGVVAVLRFQMSHQGDDAAMTTIDLVCKEIPRLNLLHEIVRFKAREEPIQAAKWLEDQPDTKYKRELYANLTRIWYDQDGIAASLWVGTLSPGDSRDAAAQALVNEVVRFDIKSAIAWGSEIQDAYLRKQTFRQISRMPSEQIKQTIQTMGHSLKLSKEDLNALTNDE